MFTEIENAKSDSADKERTKKMILVAKDYVHFLRKRERSKSSSNSDFIKVDGTSVSVPTLGQLLASLKDDLRCSTTIFLEEFIVCGGIECLLDVLRLSQSQQNQPTTPMRPRQQQTALRKALAEQYDCLMALKHASKSTKAVKRISESSHGASTITSCIMSSSEKARILVLELLCRLLDCSNGSNGHSLILEALTANRVLFGEPVRFKFLVGMLQGNVSDKPVFQTTGLKFLNYILKTCAKPAERIRLQCELEEAGLNVPAIESALRAKQIPLTDKVWEEIATWRKSYLDMENVEGQKQTLETQNEKLQKEVQLLRKALQKLEEDKINLMQIEMELKEKCEDLNEEVTTLKTEIKQTKPSERVVGGFTLKDTPNLRHFGDEDGLFLLSGESGQLETEEIFIDVPTIRPPIEFRTDSSTDSLKRNKSFSEELPKIHEKTLLLNLQNSSAETSSTGIGSKPTTLTNSSSDKESADSALSESESDSGINWNYPDIPEASVTFESRNSRSRHSRRMDESSDNFLNSTTKRIPLHQRSQSEDRRETGDFSKSRRYNMEGGETKVVGSTGGFFMMRRPETDAVSRQSSLPVKDTSTRHPASNVTPSYQLPVAYRSNFLSRGHSNCDLYSGISDMTQKLEHFPPIPPPDYGRGVSVANSGGTISALVHREITKAVRQISGWI